MILLKNGKVCDGTGKKPFIGDILIKGNRILAIGIISRGKAETVIDCHGVHALAPGIIDASTTSDHYLTLFSHPDQTDFLLQGVTTIIGGHCGASLAPLTRGSLEPIGVWADPSSININWHSMQDYLNALKRRRLGVNFGTLVGHATLRHAIIGNAQRELAPSELHAVHALLEKTLDEGAFGISIGEELGEGHATLRKELYALSQIVARYDGVSAIHLRDDHSRIIKSFEEAESLAHKISMPVIINHMRPFEGYEALYDDVLQRITHQAPETQLYFTVSPLQETFVPIPALLPHWARQGSMRDILATICNPEARAKLLKEWRHLPADRLTIVISRHLHPFLIGKTIAEFAENRGLDPAEGLLELMNVTQLRAIICMRTINAARIPEMILHARALPASHSAAFFDDPQRKIKFRRNPDHFARFLKIAGERGIPFEDAMTRVTGHPADIFRIQHRGKLRIGNYADIVIWKDNRANTVIVNGKIAVLDGEPTGIRNGSVLRRGEE